VQRLSIDAQTVNGDVSSVSLVLEVHSCTVGEPFGGGQVSCGDGSCNGSETNATCPQDCPAGPVCGNGQCESGETATGCPADCGSTGPVCGNQSCESGETSSSCPADCGTPGGDCSDGFLTDPLRDGWFGIENVRIPPGVTKHFCAEVPAGSQYDRLRFEASDLSNRTCARAEVTVRQDFGTGWVKSSGVVSSPSLRQSAVVSRSQRNYALTAPGRYIVEVAGFNAPSDCQKFDVSWLGS